VVLFFGKLQFFLKFQDFAFALTMEAASFFFGFVWKEKDTADSVLKFEN
jgi:hypothetical protein